MSDDGIHGTRPISWQIDRLVADAEADGHRVVLIRAAKPLVQSLAAELSPGLGWPSRMHDSIMYRGITVETDDRAQTGWVAFDANGEIVPA
jgi:hypothetical protein